ncbi:unnamed protein product [Scytosiphon promiscuus]
MASPSMSVSVMAASESNEAGVGELQQQDMGSDEFEGLLPSNVLDTLADFDFSCADLAVSAGSTDTPQQQHLSFSPKLSGRKRSFTQACNWDNLGPKAISEMSAGLLAGGWENGTVTPQFLAASSPSPASRVDSFPAGTPADAVAAAALAPGFPHGREFGGRTSVSVSVSAPGTKHKRPPAPIRSHGAAAADSRKGLGSRCATKPRRGGAVGGVAGAGAAGGGKKPLNPDRMERKASREKRRREEVNEKFEQLLEVLEDAEATSGLDLATAEEGKSVTANACINGRRVEVLSRTIKILKKLLEEKRDALSGGPTSAATAVGGDGGGCGGGSGAACRKQEDDEEEGPVLHSLLERKFADEEKPPLLAAGNPPGGVPECHRPPAGRARTPFAVEDPTAAASATEEKDGCNLHVHEAQASAMTSATGAGTANPAPNLVHHMTMPVPGHHHAPIMMPPGFAGMSAPHGMPGHPGQPIFIAVPMYMPQGQGMGPHTPSPAPASEAAVGQAPPAAPSSSSLSSSAAANAAATPEAALRDMAGGMKKAMGGSLAKEAWAMPAGMGYPSMTTLQMPQFVAQALSSEEPDETPTHAVCA